jgi:Cysteine rich repeat
MIKAALIAVALVLVPLTASSQESPAGKDPGPIDAGRTTTSTEAPERRFQNPLSTIIPEAIDKVMDACDDDIEEFCESVTSGGGRIAMCVLAHEDQLSGGCRSALSRAPRQLRRSIDELAQGCLNEIRTLCSGADKARLCVEQKKESLTASCKLIVGSLSRKLSMLTAQSGMPVFSSDNKKLGQIIAIVRGPDDSIQSIQVDIGRSLGIGTKLVTITADKMRASPGLNVQLSESEVRALPEVKGQ